MEQAGKVALVTGGGSGMGETAAVRFAREGARVVICGRTKEKLERTVDEARTDGTEIVDLQADISDPQDVRRLFEEVDERFGRLAFSSPTRASTASGRRWRSSTSTNGAARSTSTCRARSIP